MIGDELLFVAYLLLTKKLMLHENCAYIRLIIEY